MKRWSLLTCLVLPAVVLAFLPADRPQKFDPPEPVKPTETQLKAINERKEKLATVLSSLQRQGVRDPAFADMEIFWKAAEWTQRHNEFYKNEYIDWTIEALERGLVRASHQSQGDTPWFAVTGRSVVHGYRSRVDNSVQPYAVTLPADYGKDRSRRYRVDVVLHGRDVSLTEVSFLHNHDNLEAPKEQEFVRIDVYGRGNNAYRWAGETDVYEALDNFLAVEKIVGRDLLIDRTRFVLRGFSMGGAGTWHMGLHRPDRWCVLGPGAGFTTTREYVEDFPKVLPSYIESCLKIYDAVEYAENVFNVPVVAYHGKEDPQRDAANLIVKRLEKIKDPKLSIKQLVSDLGHKFPAEWQAKAEKEYRPHIDAGRSEYPKRVRFVTHTLKYHRCDWVELFSLEKHYERALVDAEETEDGFKVSTANVRSLHLSLKVGDARASIKIDIDADKLETIPWEGGAGEKHVFLVKQGGKWDAVARERIFVDQLRRPQKMPGLQGPIDDAFTESFLCVSGTGKAWNQAVADHAKASMERFVSEWSKYMRGELQVKEDVKVTSEDMASRHLILFGDPGSNRLIPQLLDQLPLTWTREKVSLGGKEGPAATHLPVLIYPSPLNVQRYVVLNSGHTFRAEDFRRTNAMLYPRLGDYALLKLAPTKSDPLAVEVISAGLFDEFWKQQPAPARNRP